MPDDPETIRRELILHAAKRRQHIERADRETEALRTLARRAVEAGLPKSHIAGIAQISRPTLDAWLEA